MLFYVMIVASVSPMVSNDIVVESQQLSDHKLIVGNLHVKRVKLPPTSYEYHDIKHADAMDFWCRIQSSTLFDNSEYSSDAYLDEIEQVMFSVLEAVAPLWTEKRPRGQKSS